jgi:hypothetical protein
MAIDYTWTIAQLERNTSDGGVDLSHTGVYQRLMETTLHQSTAQWVARPIPELPIGIAFER